MKILLDCFRSTRSFAWLANALAWLACAGLLLCQGQGWGGAFSSTLPLLACLVFAELFFWALPGRWRHLKKLANKADELSDLPPEQARELEVFLFGLPAVGRWQGIRAWLSSAVLFALYLRQLGGPHYAFLWWAEMPQFLAWLGLGLCVASAARMLFNEWSLSRVLPALEGSEGLKQGLGKFQRPLERDYFRSLITLAGMAALCLGFHASLLWLAPPPGWGLPLHFWPGVLWISLWLFLFAFGYARLLQKKLVHPLEDLHLSLKHLQGGDYDLVLDPSLYREVEALNEDLNVLAGELSKNQAVRETFSRLMARNQAEALLEKGLKLDGEKRFGSVLCCRLEGFGSLCEGLAPEATAKLLNRYYQVVSTVVERHQGCLAKLEGGEVLAVFNLPLEREGFALAAASCAWDLMQHLKIWATQQMLQQRASAKPAVGLASGLLLGAYVGPKGRQAYHVMGQAYEDAKCLAVEADVILVDETISSELGDLIKKETAQPLNANNNRKIKVFRLLGVAVSQEASAGVAIDKPVLGFEPGSRL